MAVPSLAASCDTWGRHATTPQTAVGYGYGADPLQPLRSSKKVMQNYMITHSNYKQFEQL